MVLQRPLPYLVCLLALLFACCLALNAQTLIPGSVSGVTPYLSGPGGTPGACPSDFWSPPPPDTPSYCYSATMTCSAYSSTVPILTFIYSYAFPGTHLSSVLGTVVLFSGGSGVLGTLSPTNQLAAGLYLANYEVVQVAWTTDWEISSDPLGIMTAACRPAGFLDYARQTSLLNARLSNGTSGFCADGGSAGAGALAYSITDYNDSSGSPLYADLDDAEMTSGPAFGNIELGCQVPAPPTPASICLSGQFGCSSGTTTWSDPFPYIPPYVSQVGNWTNDLTCGSASGTSALSNGKWLAMSIVNGSSGNFTYTHTGLAGWLCASSVPSTCTPASPCPNNSSAEGNVFFSQITGTSQARGYKLTGITECINQEGVLDGDDPDVVGQTGLQAIVAHVVLQCTHPSP